MKNIERAMRSKKENGSMENCYGLITDYDTEKERNLKDLIDGNNCKAKRGFGKKMVMNSPYKEKMGLIYQ